MIYCTLLPAVLGISPPNDTIRSLVALPPRWGGLGVFNPTVQCTHEYSATVDITGPLSQCIVLGQSFDYFQMRTEPLSRKFVIRLFGQSAYSDTSSSLCSHLNHSLQTALDLTTIRGASAWLSALLLSEYGFTLHKAAFHDAIALRYGWPLHQTPSHCGCDAALSVDHTLSCPKGGLPSLCHNEIRDLTAHLLTEVCHQVQVEPELQPVSNPDSFLQQTPRKVHS